MYNTSAKRRKHHAKANQQPANHNDRSAAIAIDKNAAQGACRDDRGGRGKQLTVLAPSHNEVLLHRQNFSLTSSIHRSEHD